MASSIRKDDANAQVSANSLVNEAWLKLKNSKDLQFKSSVHFKMVAARAAADDEISGPIPGERELLALRHSLEELSAVNPRQGFLVKSRYFGGLAMGEIAALLQVSESPALREWRAARAWLGSKIRGGPQTF